MPDPKKKSAFDPSQYGATPADSTTGAATFDPSQYGAEPYSDPANTPGALRRLVTSFNEQFGVPKSVQDNPKEALQGIKLAVSHPSLEAQSLGEMYKGMNQAQQDLIDEAYQLQNTPGIESKAKGFATGFYASIPVLGPAYVSALKQWESGDQAGAIGSILGLVTQLKGGMRGAGKEVPSVEGAAMNAGAGLEPKPTPSHFRTAAQKMLRAGPELTREAGKRFAKESAEATEKQATETAKVDRINRGRVEKHATELRKTAQENLEAKHQYTADVEEAKGHAKAQQDAAKSVDTKSVQLGKSIENLEEKVGAEADRRFNEVKKKVGNPEAPPTDLIASVKNVQTNILQDIPENVKEFRRILGMEGEAEGPLSIGQGMEIAPGERGYEAVKQAYVQEGLLKETEPLTWDKLQSLKSRIDARLRGPKARNLNGDLKRALYAVRDSVVDEMGKMAEAKGAGELWQGARDFYRQYKEDFYTPSGPSGSGSPVAQSFDAVDPSNIRQPFLKTQSAIGNRGIDILKKYGQYGGNETADLASQVISEHGKLGEMPKPKEPTVPVPKQAPPKPELKPSPVVEQPTAPNIREMRKDAILKKAADWQAFSKWEVRGLVTAGGILAAPFVPEPIKALVGTIATFPIAEQIIGRIVEKKSVLEWLSKPTPADLKAIQSLPPDVRAKFAQQLQLAANEEAQATGRKMAMNPQLQQLLRAGGTGTVIAGSATRIRDLRERAKQNAAQ